MNLIIYLIIINILAFLLCGVDKRSAINNTYRISEEKLLTISVAGGCFGFILGMHIFHHKTRKIKFKFVYLFAIIWIVIIVYEFI
ncbi:MAG: DUF1294 domain-containing protein [Bacilli bacterium]|nr:DUF1294 domain-containing protein [Bacilli bacterium]